MASMNWSAIEAEVIKEVYSNSLGAVALTPEIFAQAFDYFDNITFEGSALVEDAKVFGYTVPEKLREKRGRKWFEENK